MYISKGMKALLLSIAVLPKWSYSKNSELAILSNVYNICNGENWIQKDNWMNSDVDTCDWFGVTCNSEGNVKMLRLRNNKLDCEIPEDVFSMPSLTLLDLSGNKKSSINFRSINSERATALKELHVADGAIASLKGIGKVLGNLTALNAAGNFMEGEFPVSVLELEYLISLDLSHNSLSGTIPAIIGTAITSLQTLKLSNNRFSGSIPSTLGSLRDLSRLTVQSNNLRGSLPAELSKLTSLTQISFNDNSLSGPMLDFPNSPFLLSINGKNNMLTGTIPNTLLQSVDPKYSMASVVDMSNNKLTGSVPITLSRFSSLRIFLFGNMLDELDENLCSQVGGWFFDDVNLFGCDAIM